MKKNYSCFLGDIVMGVFFAHFWLRLPGRGANPTSHFLTHIFLESRLSSQPSEPMISVLAYREQKFWLTNQRLGKHLSPTNGNHGCFLLEAITSQQIELECCSNPVEMEESLIVCNGKKYFRFGCRSFFVVCMMAVCLCILHLH